MLFLKYELPLKPHTTGRLQLMRSALEVSPGFKIKPPCQQLLWKAVAAKDDAVLLSPTLPSLPLVAI